VTARPGGQALSPASVLTRNQSTAPADEPSTPSAATGHPDPRNAVSAPPGPLLPLLLRQGPNRAQWAVAPRRQRRLTTRAGHSALPAPHPAPENALRRALLAARCRLIPRAPVRVWPSAANPFPWPAKKPWLGHCAPQIRAHRRRANLRASHQPLRALPDRRQRPQRSGHRSRARKSAVLRAPVPGPPPDHRDRWAMRATHSP